MPTPRRQTLPAFLKTARTLYPELTQVDKANLNEKIETWEDLSPAESRYVGHHLQMLQLDALGRVLRELARMRAQMESLNHLGEESADVLGNIAKELGIVDAKASEQAGDNAAPAQEERDTVTEQHNAQTEAQAHD